MTHVCLRRGLTLGVCLLLLGPAGFCSGQDFDSGSDGSDGDLVLSTSGIFDPTELDDDGDGVYHFRSIHVEAGVTVRFPASVLGQGRPIVWLAQQEVTIEGTLDLNGSSGHSGGPNIPVPADAGAGGFFGGPGGSTLGVPPRAGSGPGGGSAGQGMRGGGGGHVAPGTVSGSGAPGGPAYGNVFLLPLIGGSGGGGGAESAGGNGSGGGGGGGAILIASSKSITIPSSGKILALGGTPGGGATFVGGGGSGGAVRLIAPTITVAGSIDVRGGGSGAAGRVRLEAFTHSHTGTLLPTSSVTQASPGPVFLPPNAPTIRVTAVGGVPVTATPTGSFVTPDVVINSATPVTLDVAGENIPPGTEVRITLVPENGASMTVTATLTGTFADTTGTTSPVTIPHGFSRFFVAATWSPQ